MRDIQTVTVTGRIVADAATKVLPTGTSVTSFAVASNSPSKKGKDGVKANFFNCELYGKNTAKIGEYITKGRKITVWGELRQDKWEDKATGAGRTAVKIVVNQVILNELPGQNHFAVQETPEELEAE